MMSISFPSGPSALRLDAGRGRWCMAEGNVRVEAADAAVGDPLQPPLLRTDAGRIKPLTHDTATSTAGRQRRTPGAMVQAVKLAGLVLVREGAR